MKETGIIMSGNHPRLILDGLKTMTRRVIVPQPTRGAWNATAEHPSYGWFWKKLYQTWDGEEGFFRRLLEQCPYGQVGDRLWVRETWAEQGGDIYYKADWGNNKPVNMFYDRIKWRSSRFMPRWASRINLEITGIRVERLQEISREDIAREGCPWQRGDGPWDDIENARRWFRELWDSLNGKRYPWSMNPWVWVVSFKEISG